MKCQYLWAAFQNVTHSYQMLSRKHGPQVCGATGAEGDGSLRLQAWSTSVWRHRSLEGWLAEAAGMVHKCVGPQEPTDAKPANLSPPLQDELRPASPGQYRSGQQAQRSSVSIGAVSMR